MKRVLAAVLTILLLFAGCGGNSTKEQNSYRQITQKAAKEMMDTREVVILDVREQHEYDSGHIPGAVLLPVGTITAETAAKQPRRPLLTSAIPKYMSLAESTNGPMKWSFEGRGDHNMLSIQPHDEIPDASANAGASFLPCRHSISDQMSA